MAGVLVLSLGGVQRLVMIPIVMGAFGYEIFYLSSALWLFKSTTIVYYFAAYSILIISASVSAIQKDRKLFALVALFQGFLIYYRFVLIYGANLGGDVNGEVFASAFTLAHGWPGAVPVLPYATATYFGSITSNLNAVILSLATSLSPQQVYSLPFPAALLTIPLLVYLIFSKFGFAVGALSTEIFLTDYSTLVEGQGVIRDHMSELMFLVVVWLIFRRPGITRSRFDSAALLIGLVGLIVSHVYSLVLFPLMIAGALGQRLDAGLKKIAITALVVMGAWETIVNIGTFGAVLVHTGGVFQQLLGTTATSVVYSPASTFSPTGTPTEFITYSLYRFLIVLGLILMGIKLRKSSLARFLVVVTFSFLAFLSLYVFFPGGAVENVGQPVRLYDLFLPILAGMIAYSLISLTLTFKSANKRLVLGIVVVLLVLVFGLNSLTSTPTYQYTPWQGLSLGQQVISASYSTNYLPALATDRYLADYLGPNQVIATDQAGIDAIAGVVNPFPNLNNQLVPTTDVVRGDLMVLNNYFVGGYSAWGFGSPLPVGSKVFYPTTTIRAIILPPSADEALEQNSLLYDNGKMYTYLKL